MLQKLLLYLYLFFPIVLPNSLRNYTVPVFVFICGCTLIAGFKYIGKRALGIYAMFAVTSLFYIFIGSFKVDTDAVIWLSFVYILSPLLWLSYWSHLLRLGEIKEIVRLIILYGFIGCLSVFAFFYFYINFGIESLMWLIEVPNIEIKDGMAAATMHVYGSLIFVISAFFSSPNVIKNNWLRLILYVTFIIAVFISGRSALILAMFIGIFIKLIGLRVGEYVKIFKSFFYIVGAFPLLILFERLVTVYVFQGQGTGLDFFKIVDGFLEKIAEGGGEERILQFYSLIDGIGDNWMLGAGHGANVSVIRSEDKPWKYELLWLSTLYHVGIVGFFIYILPLLLASYSYIKLGQLKKRNSYDKFIFSGFISISIASMTNPYLESFDFQWMIVLPFVYFYRRYISTFSSSFL